MRQAAITSWREEKKSGASFGLSYLLNIVLALYDKEVFAGFSSLRGFPRINDVSLMNVYFSVILFL
jgi:hypothetical protein